MAAPKAMSLFHLLGDEDEDDADGTDDEEPTTKEVAFPSV